MLHPLGWVKACPHIVSLFCLCRKHRAVGEMERMKGQPIIPTSHQSISPGKPLSPVKANPPIVWPCEISGPSWLSLFLLLKYTVIVYIPTSYRFDTQSIVESRNIFIHPNHQHCQTYEPPFSMCFLGESVKKHPTHRHSSAQLLSKASKSSSTNSWRCGGRRKTSGSTS